MADTSMIAGRCPMGCGNTLFAAPGGYITCSHLPCPRPSAVAELLEDGEVEHIVHFDDDTFTVRHPLRERLDDALMTCDLTNYIAHLDGPPVRPGIYRARRSGERWTWEAVASRG